MITIYAVPISLYCAKLRILLRHKGLQWSELSPPGGYGSGEYKKIIPSGNLPAMVDGELTLADSEVIAEYLNEKHPHPQMLPAEIDQRARARERSRFHDTRVEPELRKLFPFIDGKKPDADLIEHQSMQISIRLKQLSKFSLNPDTAFNDRLTLGDCGLPITFVWIDALTPLLQLKIDWPDSIFTYRQEIETYPAVAAEIESYRPILNQWLKSLDR